MTATQSIPCTNKLSVPAKDVHLSTVSPSTINGIWYKAERLLHTPNAVTPAPGNNNARMVASDSSSRPHFVQKTTGNKFLCDENCPMWRGRKLCAHTVAVAESFNSLAQFVDALHKSKPECNLTKLVMTSNDRCKAGTKSGTSRRRGSNLHQVPITAYRSRLDDVWSAGPGPSSSVPTDSTTAYEHASPIGANSSYVGGDVSVECSSQTYNYHQPRTSDYPHFTPPPWYASPCHSSPYELYSYNYSPYCGPCGSRFQSETSESRPFVVKLLNNRIKKCRGCNREFARKVDGSLPDPPLDMVVCHEERRPFKDSSNITRLSRPHNVYYHANLSCIRMSNPTFLPHHLQIPAEFELSDAHKKYLREHLGCDC